MTRIPCKRRKTVPVVEADKHEQPDVEVDKDTDTPADAAQEQQQQQAEQAESELDAEDGDEDDDGDDDWSPPVMTTYNIKGSFPPHTSEVQFKDYLRAERALKGFTSEYIRENVQIQNRFVVADLIDNLNHHHHDTYWMINQRIQEVWDDIRWRDTHEDIPPYVLERLSVFLRPASDSEREEAMAQSRAARKEDGDASSTSSPDSY